jgi:ribosomal protein L40E
LPFGISFSKTKDVATENAILEQPKETSEDLTLIVCNSCGASNDVSRKICRYCSTKIN